MVISDKISQLTNLKAAQIKNDMQQPLSTFIILQWKCNVNLSYKQVAVLGDVQLFPTLWFVPHAIQN